MLSRFTYVLTLTALVTLAGCATMSKKECQHANWEAKGETDGLNGALPDHLNRHAQACAKVGITPHRANWEKGRKKGLLTYCTEANAYQTGRSGHTLTPVCGFVGRVKLLQIQDHYEDGRRIYRLEKQMDDLMRAPYDRDGNPAWHRYND